MSGCTPLDPSPIVSDSAIHCRPVSPSPGSDCRCNDRGKVLVQAMLMLTGGGEACADIERLRSQAGMFGSVPSDSTLYRTFRSITPETLSELWNAVAEVRAKVWRRSAATTGTATVVLDIDGSLHQIHSENKQEAAANYKGGYGFHPIYCFADATGETLAVRLRPGNAGANNIADHVALLDAAIAGLPPEIAVGHLPGDDAGLVRRPIQVRTGPLRAVPRACPRVATRASRRPVMAVAFRILHGSSSQAH